MKHLLFIKVSNSFGVLSHVTGLFVRRGYNIDSLTVAPTEDESFSMINLVVYVKEENLSHLILQILKLPQVILVEKLKKEGTYQRELLLLKIIASVEQQNNIANQISTFNAVIVERTKNDILFQLVAEPDKITIFLDYLSSYKTVSIARTGVVSVASSSFGL